MNTRFILNFVFFQLLWFSCVVGAGGYGLHWLALAAILPITLLTLTGVGRWQDFGIAAVALCVGVFLDNLWVRLDILAYPQSALAPYWIGILWYGLGLTVNHSLSWFRDRVLIGPLAVGIFAPVTYLTGARFGAVVVENLLLTGLISLSWVVLFYGLSRYSLWMREAQLTHEQVS